MFSTSVPQHDIAGTSYRIGTYRAYPLLNTTLLRLLDFYII